MNIFFYDKISNNTKLVSTVTKDYIIIFYAKNISLLKAMTDFNV